MRPLLNAAFRAGRGCGPESRGSAFSANHSVPGAAIRMTPQIFVVGLDPPYWRNAIQQLRRIFRMDQVLGGGNQTVEFGDVLVNRDRACLRWRRLQVCSRSGAQADRQEEERQQNEKRTAPTHLAAYTAAGAVVPPCVPSMVDIISCRSKASFRTL